MSSIASRRAGSRSSDLSSASSAVLLLDHAAQAGVIQCASAPPLTLLVRSSKLVPCERAWSSAPECMRIVRVRFLEDSGALRIRGGGCGMISKPARLGVQHSARGGPPAKEEQHPVANSGANYVELAPLRVFLESGDVALVRASHFLELAQTPPSIFRRRQDLPEGAIVDAAMLERSFRELSEWDDYLRNPKQPFHTQLMRFPPFVIASYAWSSKEHPDADGRQLREVLAPAIEWYMCERAKLIREGGFMDAPKLSNPNTPDGADFGIFLDFSSMYQGTDRTPEQRAAFDRALRSMDLLYAHQRTCVWRLTRRLDGHTGLQYSERGWPFFETTVSQLITLAPNVLDLGTAQAVNALQKFQGRARTADELVKGASYQHFVDPGTHGALLDARRPPLLPDDFKDQMKDKTLTNGKDTEVVIGLQLKVAKAVLSCARSLDFSSLGWGDSDAQLLAKALQWCGRLGTINLSSNKIGAEGAAALAMVLRENTTIASIKCAPHREPALVDRPPHKAAACHVLAFWKVSVAADVPILLPFAVSRATTWTRRPPSTSPRASSRTRPSRPSSTPPHTPIPTVSSR